VSLDSIDNDPPMASVIEGSKWTKVTDFCGADEGLLVLDALQVVDGVLRVGQHVFVEGSYGSIVIFDGLLQINHMLHF